MLKKLIYLSVIIILGFLLFQQFRGGSSPEPEKSAEKEPDAEVKQEISAFIMDGRSPKGAQKWRLEGVSAEIMDDKIHLNDINAKAWTDQGTADLSSREGYYYRDRAEVELIGRVRIESSEGAVLTTERALWTQKTNEVRTLSKVYITRDNFDAEGVGGSANSELKTAQLDEDVWVKVKPSTEIVCSGPLLIEHDKNKATFHDDVVVEDDDGRLIADTLTVYFDPETKKVSQVVAEGNVKVKRGKSYTLSEKAVYTENTASAKISGRARMIIDPEQVEEFDEMGGFPGLRRREGT